MDGLGALSDRRHKEAPSMSHELLECVEALKDVRREMQNDFDPSIVAALSEVITKLEGCETGDGGAQLKLREAALTALGVVSDIVLCLNGIAELIQHLRA